jgi:large subunit ribosomal protein L29
MGKTTTAAEIREMSDEQLALTLKESSESLFRLRLQAETERLDAPTELKKHRRLIARIKTIQTERARKAAKQAAAAPAGSPSPT